MSEDARAELALRLKALREERWPRCAITQGQLAEALRVSVPSISSWESSHAPKLPPVHRLEAYATFFATTRSVDREPYRLLDPGELTAEESGARDRLLAELTALRSAAVRPEPAPADGLASEVWRFPGDTPVTIVCAKLPPELLAHIPYADPDDPDHIELYTYADPDALLNLYGHIRAVNPATTVTFRTAPEVPASDFRATHLVALGGVDWNAVTRNIMERLELPVRQETRPEESAAGYFEVTDGDRRRQFHPRLQEIDGRRVLLSDVAHFYRGPNPFNPELTVTLCNGMFGRGTLGAARALTDSKVRERNEEYIARRFAGRGTISIISRVSVVNGKAVPPDWTIPDVRLHEWSKEPP